MGNELYDLGEIGQKAHRDHQGSHVALRGTKPLWLLTWLPFDIAAACWLSAGGWRFAVEHAIDGFLQVGTGRDTAIFRTRVIELTCVEQGKVFIEEKKIGCACRAVCLGDSLSFIDKIGEVPLMSRGKFFHEFRAILWISGEIIRVDADRFHAKCCGAVSKFAEFACEVDDVRTMVAGKKYDGA